MNQSALFIAAFLIASSLYNLASAADLTLKLTGDADVTVVGAIRRWDADGNPRRPIDPKAKIAAPRLDAKAVRAEPGRWVFADLPPGKYDLVILGKDRLRIEGFSFAPVLEFDSFLSRDAKVDDEHRKTIVEMISKSRHYENKVVSLHLGGDDKVIRALVELVRDKPTSYEGKFPGAATIRHEIWQFTWRYGGWAKEKRTKVLDRLILHRDELHKWTWLWTPELGGIDIADQPIGIELDMLDKSDKKGRP